VGLPPALTGPALQFLWEAVHDRYSRQAEDTPVRTVTVTDLTAGQRDALAGLLGSRRLPGPTVTVRLADLDRRLLDSDAAASARQVAETVCGPIVNRPAERRAAERDQERMWAELEQAAGAQLTGWLRQLRASGTVARAARVTGLPVDRLLAQALTAARRLPADGVQLARLAEQATGDPHALDRGRPLRTLVLQAALHLAGEPGRVPVAAAAQRAVLATVGIDTDTVSPDVLVLGLGAVGTSHVDRMLNEATAAGEPFRLSLRMLRRALPTLDQAARPLSVCENPSVLEAAADRLGGACAPLLCTDGIPTTAALLLLQAARGQGIDIRVSADFDPGGLRIVNLLADRVGAVPWRYTADAYRRAVAAREGLPAVRLGGRIPEASFDPDLAAELRRSRVAVFEEQQTDLLLEDLGKHSRARRAALTSRGRRTR
jgi:uncharacterized protein (TIGR02679 family)